MPSMPTTIEDLQKLCESTERMIAELTRRPHTIGPEDLQFLEVPFLKPTCKNPKSRNV